MSEKSEDRLNRLLKEAYPAVEVSPDFTLRLWRRLMERPLPSFWRVPVPVLSLATALGMVAGLWTWGNLPETQATFQVARWDLFGNAPVDSLAGSFLNLMKGESA